MTERVEWEKEFLEEQQKKAALAFVDIKPETETTTPIESAPIQEVKPIQFLDPDGWSFGGYNLLDQVKNFTGKVEMMVEGLIAKNSLNMWYATDGIGKSIMGIQTALEQAHGLKVFGHLECYGRQNVIYVVAERHQNEPLQRIKIMHEKYGFDFKNFHITGKFQGYNLANEKNHLVCLGILQDIANYEFGGKVDHIYFDPINALCTGDMKEDSVASTIRTFLCLVMNKFNCSVTFTHHENRGQRNKKGVREGQDFYGNKNLSTMCTSIMHIKSNMNGTVWVNEKDSYTCIYNPLPLIFDSEFMLSELDKEHTPITKTVQIHKFINHLFIMNETFTRHTIEQHAKEIDLKVTNHLMSHIIKTLIKDKKIENLNPLGKNAKYRILGKIDL
jgi:hypothetical protein